LLHPQVLDVDLAAVALGPEEIAVAFERRDDVLVVDERDDPFLLAPDPGAVGINALPVAVLEQLHPGGRGAGAERLHVVLDLEQVAARGTTVDDLEQ
jgi:hypothetical protein